MVEGLMLNLLSLTGHPVIAPWVGQPKMPQIILHLRLRFRLLALFCKNGLTQ
jgi:hypothetical protein